MMQQIYLRISPSTKTFSQYLTIGKWYPFTQHFGSENLGYLLDDTGRIFPVDLNQVVSKYNEVWEISTERLVKLSERVEDMFCPEEDNCPRYKGIRYADSAKINRRFLP